MPKGRTPIEEPGLPTPDKQVPPSPEPDEIPGTMPDELPGHTSPDKQA